MKSSLTLGLFIMGVNGPIFCSKNPPLVICCFSKNFKLKIQSTDNVGIFDHADNFDEQTKKQFFIGFVKQG